MTGSVTGSVTGRGRRADLSSQRTQRYVGKTCVGTASSNVHEDIAASAFCLLGNLLFEGSGAPLYLKPHNPVVKNDGCVRFGQSWAGS